MSRPGVRPQQATTPGARALTAEQQVRQLAGQATAPRYVKNCGDDSIEAQVSGILYFIEPDETIPIPARLQHPRDKKTGKIQLDEPPVLPTSLDGPGGGTPNLIVKELLLHHAQQGLIEIMGDGHDPERERLASSAYYKYRQQRALQAQASWMRKQRENLEDPGAIPLVMPSSVRAEIRWLRANPGEEEQNRKKWIAFDGAFESDTQDDVFQYVIDNYPQEVETRGVEALVVDRDRRSNPTAVETPEEIEAGATPIEAEELDQPATSGRVRRAVPPLHQGATLDKNLAFLRTRAEEIGVVIDEGDWQAIADGDQLTIRRVLHDLQAG